MALKSHAALRSSVVAPAVAPAAAAGMSPAAMRRLAMSGTSECRDLNNAALVLLLELRVFALVPELAMPGTIRADSPGVRKQRVGQLGSLPPLGGDLWLACPANTRPGTKL
jgi:hypothetical protein